jgi:hypothetical protein
MHSQTSVASRTHRAQKCEAVAMKLRLTIALATTAGLLLSGAAVAAEPDAADRAPNVRIVKPGQVGKGQVGMTIAEAMATGEFNRNVENPPCEPVRLQPKGAWKNQYVVFARAKITGMAVFGTRPRTGTGLGVGSTVRELREVYGTRLSKPRVVGYEQWGLFVKLGKGADRKWLGFLLGDAFPADGPLRPRDKVTLMGVSQGSRPDLLLDGC